MCIVTSRSLSPVSCSVVGSASDFHLASNIPDKAGELAGDRHADLIRLQLATAQLSVATRQTQLRPPGDVAHGFALAFLADLHLTADTRREAVIPGRLHQHAPRVRVTGFGDAPLAS